MANDGKGHGNGTGTSIVPRTAAAAPARAERGAAAIPIDTLDDLWRVAQSVAESKLFPVRTAQEAFALMLLCQADGLHPMAACRRYHIIQGRPTMRSDATQGEMIARGWMIRPLRRTAEEARACFAHPTRCPDGFEMGVTFEQYRKAGLTGKDNWKSYPDDMLWARLVTKAARTLEPGIVAGIYSPEEVDDMEHAASPAARHAAIEAEAVEMIRRVDAELPGQAGSGVDERRYQDVVKAAAEAVGQEPVELHRHLTRQGLAFGYLDPPPPSSLTKAITALTKVYQLHRHWVREQVRDWCAACLAAAEGEPEGNEGEPGEGEGDDGLQPAPETPWEPGADG